MHYRISCECGDAITVSEGFAGTKVSCRCGRTIVVPSLRDLRRQTGQQQPTLAPEAEVGALLLAGLLPEEDHCVLCGNSSDDILRCRIECERAYTKDDRPWWAWWLALFAGGATLGTIAVHEHTQDQTTEYGKDCIFDLPLRVCDKCQNKISNKKDLKSTLRKVPLYGRLLSKYPNSKIARLST
jgi:hypothetical protein